MKTAAERLEEWCARKSSCSQRPILACLESLAATETPAIPPPITAISNFSNNFLFFIVKERAPITKGALLIDSY